MGDDAVLGSRNEHHGKLQALGGVDGHQVHLALQGVVLHVVPGQEGDAVQVVEQAGIHITPVWEAMSTTALVNAAINGLGIAVLPHRMILPALRQGLICTVKVEGLSFSRNFHIIHHKDKFLTTSAKRFITLCRDFETDYPLPCYNGLYE